MSEEETYEAIQTSYSHILEIQLGPPEKLEFDEDAQKQIDQIAGSYFDNQKLYDDFFDKYGTHHFEHAFVGGVVKMKIFMSKSFFTRLMKRKLQNR